MYTGTPNVPETFSTALSPAEEMVPVCMVIWKSWSSMSGLISQMARERLAGSMRFHILRMFCMFTVAAAWLVSLATVISAALPVLAVPLSLPRGCAALPDTVPAPNRMASSTSHVMALLKASIMMLSRKRLSRRISSVA